MFKTNINLGGKSKSCNRGIFHYPDLVLEKNAYFLQKTPFL